MIEYLTVFQVEQRQRIVYWTPALLAGFVALLAFTWVGNTPLLRALALAVVIVGVSLSLRRLSAPLSFFGGLALAFCPAYWQQTGGPQSISFWWMLAFVLAAGVFALAILRFSRRLFLSVAIGVSVFVGLYLAVGITQKSLRLTTILSAWLVYMLIIALRQTNPRPDEPAAVPLSKPHIYGVLLMLTLGILNEPLFTLFAPGVVLGLWLSHARLPWWYWLTLAVIVSIGGYRISQGYISPTWLHAPATAIDRNVVNLPFIILDGWRDPAQWMWLTRLMMHQFTWVGALLGIVGIARMSRWYPTLGVTLMIIYASYGAFGLMYFGADLQILLMPMLIIQVICIVYAVYAVLHWLTRRLPTTESGALHWLANSLLLTTTAYLLVRVAVYS